MPLLHLLRQNPVIAAVKDNASLQLAIDSECQFISVLYGNICTISNIVKKIKNAGKYAFIHVDLLEGASNKEVVIQFLKLVTEADGIISTKASMLKAARAEGFFCIHRLFIVDSISFHNIDKQVAQSNPDCIEILPGCMPKVLGWVTEKNHPFAPVKCSSLPLHCPVIRTASRLRSRKGNAPSSRNAA